MIQTAESTRAESLKPKAVVFGAGIAGLTAAHELVERGFEVTVFERSTDWESASSNFPCAVGGMAKSQWGLQTGGDAPETMLAAGVAEPGAPRNHVLPGEHGFRFFPGFYRHVYDTMKRTPLAPPGEGDTGAPYDHTVRTVYDNLVPTRASGMGLEGRGRNYALEFPRAAPRSAREVLDTLTSFLEGAGYNLRDISKFVLKIFQYMTASNLRRRTQYENVSWWDFIEGEAFAEPMRHDLDVAPAILGALVARKSDARTQGSVSVQLILDQFSGSDRTDSLLNGPTTDAWFVPWRQYLSYRGVKFAQGELVGFAVKVVGGKQRIVPQVEAKSSRPGESSGSTRLDLSALDNAFFVVATAMPDLTGRPAADAPQGALQPGLAQRFLAAARQLQSPWSASDFARLAQINTANWNNTEDSWLQHLIGVQYFFRHNDRQFVAGHSVYLDSPWRLSAISQTRFWRRPPGQMDGFDGILSVDIGNVWKASPFVQVTVGANGEIRSERSIPCIHSTREEIAQNTLQQIRRATPDNDPLPQPHYYHIDQGLHYDHAGRFIGNDTPYLVNRPGEWHLRPGRLDEFDAAAHARPPGEFVPEGYEAQCERWFLAGTFMRTHTRLTTMEAANESARHAVNGVLQQLRKESGSAQLSVDPCEIWNIEEHEAEDLRWLKELDETLMRQGQPHFIDILGLDKIPDALLPALRHIYEPLRRL